MTNNISDSIAEALFSIGAVHYSETPPYCFTSGILSPVYVDCRRPISFTAQRDRIIHAAMQVLRKLDFDVIAGGETAGIAYAAILAHVLHKDMVYVRKQPKGFGTNVLIEGEIQSGAKVLLVEDLTFDGKTKVRFSHALREAGSLVDTTFSIFNYGISQCDERLKENGLDLLWLTDWVSLLSVAVRAGRLTNDQVSVVRSFLTDPEQWSQRAGLLEHRDDKA